MVIGLGSMGGGIARSMLRAGLKVAGYDVSDELQDAFRAEGGTDLPRPQAATQAAAVVCVVVNAQQTDSVLFGDDGLAAHMQPGSVFVSCATVPPEFARATAARLAQSGIEYLDAPISGGSARAGEGRLTVMASGSAAAFERAAPVLDAMAEKVFRLGDEAGRGSALKVVNQLLAGVHIAAAAEAVTFGMTQGIDPATTLEVISECAGASWMFGNRVPHIVAGDYTAHSAVDIFVKDLDIVLDVAHRARFSAPLTAAALQQFVAASGAGFGREDDAAVAKIYARNAGLKLPGD
ncbi:MAG: NAD-binding protein [Gammaproteobacteria bacterium]|nr:NAD-binding protein [Gammaproteobacteria bacterium]